MPMSGTDFLLASPDPTTEASSRAVALLYAAHADELRRYARRIVGSTDAAEDVVQEVFLRLWLARSRVAFGVSARAYLFVSARARALDAVGRARRAAAGVRDGAGAELAERDDAADRDTGTSASVDVMSALDRVLARMPPRQRAVATLRLRERHPTAEVARRLALSPRTVEAHVARALRRLRTELPPLLGDWRQ